MGTSSRSNQARPQLIAENSRPAFDGVNVVRRPDVFAKISAWNDGGTVPFDAETFSCQVRYATNSQAHLVDKLDVRL